MIRWPPVLIRHDSFVPVTTLFPARAGEWLAPVVTNGLGIAPLRGGGVEIVRRRRAQEEALGRKDRYAAVTSRHPGECRGLSTRGHDGSLRDPGLRRDDSFGSLLTERETAEALVEARYLAARVVHLAGAAGPSRVRLGIDVALQLVAFLAPGRARPEHLGRASCRE